MEKKLNIPNTITILRLLLSIPLFYFIINEESFYAIITLILAGITELDGTIARRLDQVTAFGSILDPVVDGIFAATGFIALLMTGKLQLLPLILLGIFNLPRLVFMSMHIRRHGEAKTGALNKISALMIILIMPFTLLFEEYANYYIISMIILSAVVMIFQAYNLLSRHAST